MQFISGLIGESGMAIVTSVLALIVVLALAVLGLWLIKLTMRSTATLGRTRNRRLGVVEQLQIDAKRQLLIIRRDDVEHVLLIGGGQDVVVEAGFSSTRTAAESRPPPQQGAEPNAEPPPVPDDNLRHGERVKAMTRAAAMRQSASLRHTGLMRQRPTAIEPEIVPLKHAAGDNSGSDGIDSAKRPAGTADNGHTGFGATRDFSRTGRANTQ